MESKKINQLATELTPALSDLTIIGDPTTGISKKITLSQMASLFTGTVEEYANLAAFPLVGTADTIYIALDTNIIYRWNTGTSAYVELSPNIVTSLVFSDANGFDGTISLVGSTATLTITTALTTGSVPFIGASGALSQDNANLFFDDTNNRLGINTNAPTTALDVFGSGIIGRLNGTSTNNSFLGFASAGTNKWSIGNVQSDHRFRIYNEATTSELVSVLQTGEFGIGIANPTTKFHIDGGASALIANLDANVSVAKSVSFRSDNSNRFNIEVSGTESGSNAGADFFIRRYSDAGALIDTPLTITRSTGNATFSGILTTPQVKAATSAGLSINANSGTQVADFGAGGSANITFFGGLNGTTAIFSSSTTATAFIPTGSTIPTNGMYLSAANTLNFATNSTNRISISSVGGVTLTGALSGTGATFSGSVLANTSFKVNNNIGYLLRTDNDGANLGGFSRRSYWAGGAALDPQIFAETGYGIYLNVDGGSTKGLYITSGGNLQITASDSALYTRAAAVNKAIYWDIRNSADTRRAYIGFGSDSSSLFDFANSEGGDFRFTSGGTTNMAITNSGQVQVKGTGTLFIDGSVNNLIRTAGNSNLSLYASNNGTSGTGEMNFYTADTLRMRIFYDGYMALNSVVFNTTTSGTVRTLYIGTGAGYLLGGISSIRRSKKNIENVSNIDWLYQLNPVTFNYRKLDESKNYTEEVYEDINYGLIAEDTAPIADFLINYNEEKDGIKEMIGIEYPRLIIPLLKAVQELKTEIDILKAK